MKGTIVLLVLAVALLAGCASRGAGQEISKERAIELARQHVQFEPGRVEAVKDTDQDRPSGGSPSTARTSAPPIPAR